MSGARMTSDQTCSLSYYSFLAPGHSDLAPLKGAGKLGPFIYFHRCVANAAYFVTPSILVLVLN